MGDSALEREMHEIAVQQIAEARFIPPALRYAPGQEHPTWKTYINIPEPVMPVSSGGNEFHPDIVIVDSGQDNKPMAICEVERPSSICDETAERWKACSRDGIKLFLYVPEGYAAKTARIVLKHGIPVTRIRTYAFDDLWHVRITAV